MAFIRGGDRFRNGGDLVCVGRRTDDDVDGRETGRGKAAGVSRSASGNRKGNGTSEDSNQCVECAENAVG